MKIKDRLEGKSLLLWGYGREGKSFENYLIRNNFNNYAIYEGDYNDVKFDKYDLIIKSPGIPYLDANNKITSMTELFLSEFSKQVIGITGSKGKSTTSSMLYHVIKSSYDNVFLVGNIGAPCFDYLDQLNSDSIIVFELSCHQLLNLKISPHIAVLLNLYQEHLDYYKIFENYAKAKKNIIRYQNADDFYYINNQIELDFVSESKQFLIDNYQKFDLKLEANIMNDNANIVYQIAYGILKLDKNKIIESLASFQGLDHRLKLVYQNNNVKYYDDSISTIVESTIVACESINDIKTLILGGLDRNIDYGELITYLNNRNDIKTICMYGAGARIFKGLTNEKFLVSNLKEAVSLAKKITINGSIVLSPAAASYDHFKNFEERGDLFLKYVKEECHD